MGEPFLKIKDGLRDVVADVFCQICTLVLISIGGGGFQCILGCVGIIVVMGYLQCSGLLSLRVFPVVFPFDVNAVGDKDGYCCKYEEHVEWRVVGHLHPFEIVTDHISGAKDKVPDGAEHASVAQPPNVYEID